MKKTHRGKEVKEIHRILNVLRKHKKEIEKRFSVKKIGVFGSIVREEHTEQSDIDIYIEFDLQTLTYEKYLELFEYLEKLFDRRIDLITKDGVETIRIPYIKNEIKRNVIYA